MPRSIKARKNAKSRDPCRYQEPNKRSAKDTCMGQACKQTGKKWKRMRKKYEYANKAVMLLLPLFLFVCLFVCLFDTVCLFVNYSLLRHTLNIWRESGGFFPILSLFRFDLVTNSHQTMQLLLV